MPFPMHSCIHANNPSSLNQHRFSSVVHMSVLDSGGMELYRTGADLLGRCSSSCLRTLFAVRDWGEDTDGKGKGKGEGEGSSS